MSSRNQFNWSGDRNLVSSCNQILHRKNCNRKFIVQRSEPSEFQKIDNKNRITIAIET